MFQFDKILLTRYSMLQEKLIEKLLNELNELQQYKAEAYRKNLELVNRSLCECG